jgi:hypothetical protein
MMSTTARTVVGFRLGMFLPFLSVFRLRFEIPAFCPEGPLALSPPAWLEAALAGEIEGGWIE